MVYSLNVQFLLEASPCEQYLIKILTEVTNIQVKEGIILFVFNALYLYVINIEINLIKVFYDTYHFTVNYY